MMFKTWILPQEVQHTTALSCRYCRRPHGALFSALPGDINCRCQYNEAKQDLTYKHVVIAGSVAGFFA